MPEAAEIDEGQEQVPPPIPPQELPPRAPVTPASFAAAMRLPTTTADVQRAPGVVSPAPAAPMQPMQWVNRAQPPVQPTNPPAYQSTEQAVSAALQFQARRGYQRDLDAGVPAGIALAKWAPAMFNTPPTASTASLLRATEPQLMNVAGRLYRATPSGGAAVPLTEAKPSVDTFERDRFRSYLSQARALETEISKDPDNIDNAKKRDEIKRLNNEADKLQERNRPSGAATGPKQVTTKEEYDALPSGAIYIGKNGHRYRKP